jgi:geranylgeranyl diphosphate synthase, type II
MTSSTLTDATRLSEYLREARRQVDEALPRYLPAEDESARALCPARLAAAMHYSVMAGGLRA